ncbi:MAG: hypothetical protein KAI25_09335, partial [Hyphomicrobiaceae bacterium]|nr:hypothetical protein [Hyphomicrobiaceae bacterium]
RNAVTVLTNSRGRPWSAGGFHASWYKATRPAGINDLTFHDLRGTAVTMLEHAYLCTWLRFNMMRFRSFGIRMCHQ